MSKKHTKGGNRPLPLNAKIMTGGLNKTPSAPPGSPTPASASTPEQAAAALKEAHDEAAQLVPPGELPPANGPDGTPVSDPKAVQQLAEETRRLCQALKDRVADLERKTAECDKVRRELMEGRSRLEGEQREVRQDRVRLTQQEAALRERELEAEAGFAHQLRKALDGLNAEAEALNRQLAAQRQQLAEEHAAADRERDELARRHHQALAADREALETERQALEAERRQLRQQRGQVQQDQEIFEEERQVLEGRAQRLAARQVEELRFQLGAVTEERDQARADRDALQQRLRQFDDWLRNFEGRSPREVLGQVGSLERQLADLKEQLANRPGAAQMERLQALEEERLAWEQDRLRWMQEKSELAAQLGRLRTGATEVESLRDQREALQTANHLLKQELTELKDEVDRWTKTAEGRSQFPGCAALDDAPAAQTEPLLDHRPPDLKAFADELRHRLAWDPQTGKELYYEERDVRAFLGGLAMSPLHLLQGISGTGKTSLPRAFARAVGAGLTLVEVQAGWRDRHDLLGHFNAFKHCFYESEFLQGLYRAGCPAYKDRLYLIVLDEMNLSRPEQYFADLLSALEQDVGKRELTLMTAPVPAAPRLLREGRKLPIPPNVWFLGTANHDETTVEFADKTYDRAHVMELPHVSRPFAVKKDLAPNRPLALEAFTKALDQAQKTHAEAARRGFDFLQQHLREPLYHRFRVGWSNRLQRQAQAFVPVVLAAGGTLGEAMDHLIATKVLRKLRDRHDVRPDDLTDLKKILTARWPQLDAHTPATRCRELIDHELHRLGGAQPTEESV